MEYSELKRKILANSTQFFLQDKTHKGYICPLCGSGSGPNGTGMTTKDGIHFTCWVGCFTNKDIFDIIGLQYGLKSYKEQFQKATELLGESIESNQKAISNNNNTTVDYTTLFLEANQQLNNTSYHRGISVETLNRFSVGYLAEWKHPKAPKMKASPRLIIPTSQNSYLARYAGEGNYVNYRGIIENKSKVGSTQIFNLQAIEQAQQPVFIVEGELDALSIIDVGGEAIGLGSINNTKKLLSFLQDHQLKQPLIIAMDNDSDPNTKARVSKIAKQLLNDLEKLGISCYLEVITEKYKDANDFLMADRDQFVMTVHSIIAKVQNTFSETIANDNEALQRESAWYLIQRFKERLTNRYATFFSTGFTELDKLLDGGLYPGLYFVGSISALGKTTFCLQIADHIAKTGQDVLFFSLEMASEELLAKSISRLTCKNTLKEYKNTEFAKTTRDILMFSNNDQHSNTKNDIINHAITEYEQYSKRLYIIEGTGNIGINEIRQKVEQHIHLTGNTPVVFIDYLQIIAPTDVRATDKQNIDKSVLELKRLSRDHSIPIVCISSFNRENYSSPVNLTSFKESGAIEYSSDVLIGLQYSGMDYKEGETDKIREKRIRDLLNDQSNRGRSGSYQKIQIKILKNRNGCKGDFCLDFYPKFNYFQELGENIQATWHIVQQKYGK